MNLKYEIKFDFFALNFDDFFIVNELFRIIKWFKNVNRIFYKDFDFV